MHNAVIKTVNEIANGLFDEITQVNSLNNEKGWTINSKLPLHQQLLIEPYRQDDSAIQVINKKQWQSELAEDFHTG